MRANEYFAAAVVPACKELVAHAVGVVGHDLGSGSVPRHTSSLSSRLVAKAMNWANTRRERASAWPRRSSGQGLLVLPHVAAGTPAEHEKIQHDEVHHRRHRPASEVVQSQRRAFHQHDFPALSRAPSVVERCQSCAAPSAGAPKHRRVRGVGSGNAAVLVATSRRSVSSARSPGRSRCWNFSPSMWRHASKYPVRRRKLDGPADLQHAGYHRCTGKMIVEGHEGFAYAQVQRNAVAVDAFAQYLRKCGARCRSGQRLMRPPDASVCATAIRRRTAAHDGDRRSAPLYSVHQLQRRPQREQSADRPPLKAKKPHPHPRHAARVPYRLRAAASVRACARCAR